jgi:hypothetical protein
MGGMGGMGFMNGMGGMAGMNGFGGMAGMNGMGGMGMNMNMGMNGMGGMGGMAGMPGMGGFGGGGDDQGGHDGQGGGMMGGMAGMQGMGGVGGAGGGGPDYMDTNRMLLQRLQGQNQAEQLDGPAASGPAAAAANAGGDPYAENGILGPWSATSAGLLGKMAVNNQEKGKKIRRKSKDKPKRPLSAYVSLVFF